MDLSSRQGRREQGLLIQKVVERAGLSVEDLANRIGCSRALIYQYLSGTTLAQPDRLQQIATITGVPLAYFYGAQQAAEPPKSKKAAEREDAQARLSDRLQQLDELALAQESPPDWGAVASTCERLVSLASQAYDTAAEARALLRLGRARVHMGEFSRAVDSLFRAASLFSTLGDRKGEAGARQALGNALLATGRVGEAREQFENVARGDLWDYRWTGTVSLAAVDEQLGDYRHAMEHCDDAAAILEEGRDPKDVAVGTLYVNANRVNLYLACGDFNSAGPLAERCLLEAEGLGNSDQHLEARLNLGVCALHQGRWSAAHRMLSGALPLARFLGDRSREAMSRAVFALLLAAIGDFNAATQHAKDALASALSQGDHRSELFAQMALADAYTAWTRESEARYHANQALAAAAALRISLYEAECRLRLARLGLQVSELTDAYEQIERALTTSAKLGARHVEAHALMLRTDWKLRTGDVAGAAGDNTASLSLIHDLGLRPLEWEAEALRARIGCAFEPPNFTDAESAIQQSVSMVEAARTDLRDAGIPDTILENAAWLDIYALRHRLMIDSGRTSEASDFLQQADWPPLTARIGGRGG